jgi:hypothetical protein
MAKPVDKFLYDKERNRQLARIANALEKIVHWDEQIALQLQKAVVLLGRATAFTLSQGDFPMAITGIQVGATGDFTATPNGALQAGSIPAWTADDSLVTISPAADGLSASVSVSASDVSNLFNLSVAAVNSTGVSFATTVQVPILPVGPPPATAFDINQVS